MDGIVIATPSSQHFSMASEALLAGKHVFVEKPLALDTRHAEHLIEESSRMGLQLMVGHTYLFCPAIQAAAQLLASGSIGKPKLVTSKRLNVGGIRSDAPVHWDLAAHDLSILDYLFADTPNSVSACASSSGHAVELHVGFKSELEARISVSWVAEEKCRLFEIEGTHGTLRIDDLQPRQKLSLYDATASSQSFPELDTVEPLEAAIRHFVDCIEHRRTPISSGSAALRGIRILAAADQSLRGQGVAVSTGGRAAA